MSESVNQPPQGLIIRELIAGLQVLKVDGCLMLLTDVSGTKVNGGRILGQGHHDICDNLGKVQ